MRLVPDALPKNDLNCGADRVIVPWDEREGRKAGERILWKRTRRRKNRGRGNSGGSTTCFSQYLSPGYNQNVCVSLQADVLNVPHTPYLGAN